MNPQNTAAVVKRLNDVARSRVPDAQVSGWRLQQAGPAEALIDHVPARRHTTAAGGVQEREREVHLALVREHLVQHAVLDLHQAPQRRLFDQQAHIAAEPADHFEQRRHIERAEVGAAQVSEDPLGAQRRGLAALTTTLQGQNRRPNRGEQRLERGVVLERVRLAFEVQNQRQQRRQADESTLDSLAQNFFCLLDFGRIPGLRSEQFVGANNRGSRCSSGGHRAGDPP